MPWKKFSKKKKLSLLSLLIVNRCVSWLNKNFYVYFSFSLSLYDNGEGSLLLLFWYTYIIYIYIYAFNFHFPNPLHEICICLYFTIRYNKYSNGKMRQSNGHVCFHLSDAQSAFNESSFWRSFERVRHRTVDSPAWRFRFRSRFQNCRPLRLFINKQRKKGDTVGCCHRFAHRSIPLLD